jgi:cell division protein FtsI/penicillin-binding protein 2
VSLSRRGQLTLAGLGLLAILGLGTWIFGSGVDEPRAAETETGSSPPAVAGERRVRGLSASRPAPRGLFTHLPVGLDDYEAFRARADADGSPIFHQYGDYRVEYSFDPELTRRISRVLKRGRVKRGHVIALDTRTGRVLAYVSTDTLAFPPERSYPAASLVKVVTAAAALQHAPESARRPCLYNGNQYRLTPSRVHRPRRGNTASLERALATSNNQCFAQLAVDTVGSELLLSSIEAFGWLDSPGPGHAAGSADAGKSDYDLGRLGCGLAGSRITPLHGAQLAATLASGEQIEPWWVDRVVDGAGRGMELPPRTAPRRVISSETAEELRSMLVRTTTHGTARSAFRDRRGRPKLRDVKVAGKTGNVTGGKPHGRYEWFVGVAPAADPSVAIAVLQLQSNLWWSKSSELAADVLEVIFCERGRCGPRYADRFTGDLGSATGPVLLADPDAAAE